MYNHIIKRFGCRHRSPTISMSQQRTIASSSALSVVTLSPLLLRIVDKLTVETHRIRWCKNKKVTRLTLLKY